MMGRLLIDVFIHSSPQSNCNITISPCEYKSSISSAVLPKPIERIEFSIRRLLLPCGRQVRNNNMKANVFILLFVFYSSECRKAYQPLDKNANLDFINMESGGARRGPNQQSVVQPQPKTPSGPPQPSNQPAQGQASTPSQPRTTTPKPVAVPPQTTLKPQAAPQTTPASKPQAPNQVKPVPVNPTPATNPITTPGYGTVKQLVNFYDSQGKASPIRPYSYSQAVKQG